MTCPDERLTVEGDLTRLTQMIGNLLNNAAKYTNAGGSIELDARRDAGHVVIRVRDNGIGIDPDSLPRLFNLFSQLTASGHRSQSGLGIGLSLVRKLAELHGGNVAAASEGLNKGSEFTVRLPLIQPAAGAEEPESPGETLPAPGATPRHRILVADDNLDALDSLALLLEWAGHDVRKASDGAEAVRQAVEWRPDLALLDIGMPKLNGYDVARRLRTEPWGKRLRLVALSGWGQSEDLRRSRESGFDLHLVKPVSFEALHAILGETLPPAETASTHEG